MKRIRRILGALAILGGLPAITLAQPCPTMPATASKFTDTHATNWINNVSAVVNNPQMDSTNACWFELNHALEGLETAYNSCGLWWDDYPGSLPDAGWTMQPPFNPYMPPGTAGIVVASALKKPHATVVAQNGQRVNQHVVVFHEALHASLRTRYYMREAVNAAYANVHDFVTARANACFQSVAPPGIYRRTRTPEKGVRAGKI